MYDCSSLTWLRRSLRERTEVEKKSATLVVEKVLHIQGGIRIPHEEEYHVPSCSSGSLGASDSGT